jgi:hypothetical protein
LPMQPYTRAPYYPPPPPPSRARRQQAAQAGRQGSGAGWPCLFEQPPTPYVSTLQTPKHINLKKPFQVGFWRPWYRPWYRYSNRDAAAAIDNPGRTPQMIMDSTRRAVPRTPNPSIKSSPRKSRSRASRFSPQIVSNVWCLRKVITFGSGRVGRIQEYVRNARARLSQVLESHG